MSKFDFTLYQNPKDLELPYIQLQVGKGKKHQPSLYIDSQAFDCIRGVLWNKYREFSNQKLINHINNDDWLRILNGLEIALKDLDTIKDANELVAALSTPNHLLLHKDRMFDQRNVLQQFIEELINWIKTHLKKEKYILVVQKS